MSRLEDWRLLPAVAVQACATVRAMGRQYRQAREHYELYCAVMANRKQRDEPTDLIRGLRASELKDLIRRRAEGGNCASR